ncbi:hypothetical protein [Pedobacter sp.]|uniref:hypothetical protein n=1 Tax=Pedobacter sp. TaxID=1411316 RepID=UPI003BA87411
MIYWKNAYSIQLKNGNNIIHVPLVENLYEGYNSTKSHLVAYKDSVGKIHSSIMVIKPSNGDTKAIDENKSLKNFNGDILLFDLKNTFQRGYILFEGKIIGQTKFDSSPSTELVDKSFFKLGKLMSLDGSIKPDKIQDWQENCSWVPGESYVNLIGELVIVSRKVCKWSYTSNVDPNIPEQEAIDFIAPAPPGEAYGGEIVKEEYTRAIISKDTSIINNPKAKCALDKLLNNNIKFDSLLKAFTGVGYDVTFKVKDVLTNADSRGETTYNPANKAQIYINLKRSFVNSAPPIHIAKTLLHEAFHANLMQRAHDVFGTYEVTNNWTKKPEDMTLNELMDIFESKLAGNSTLGAVHHEYIARNIGVLVLGLKEFAQKYDANYNNYDQYDYLGLAWEGSRETTYFIQNVKDTQVYYIPGTPLHMRIDSLFDNKVTPMLNNSNINCVN